MRLIDADVLKEAFEEDGHLTGYIEEFIDDTPTIEAVKQEWISVEDRLPEVGRKVLVCDVDAEPDVKHDINTFTLGCDEDGYFWSDEFGWWNEFENVTHWMPLPELPKE